MSSVSVSASVSVSLRAVPRKVEIRKTTIRRKTKPSGGTLTLD
jgi:hypothetical protein